MKYINIDFTRPKGFSFISKAIRLVQKTSFNHVRFSFKVGAATIVYEAANGKVMFVGPENQDPVKVIESFRLYLKDDDYTKFMNICMYYSGTRYGYGQILGTAISNAFGLKRNAFSDESKTQVCSELVYRVLRDVIGIKMKRNVDLIGPKEMNMMLNDTLNSNPNLVKTVV